MGSKWVVERITVADCCSKKEGTLRPEKGLRDGTPTKMDGA